MQPIASVVNLPAPFDPCTVLSWADLPPQVRHPDLRPPRPWRGPASNPRLVDAGSRLTNSLVTAGGTRGHEVFTVVVAWSSALVYRVERYPGDAEQATIAGRPALISVRSGHNGVGEIRICYVAMRAAHGGAAVEVANNRFPINERELTIRLAELLAARIP